MNKFSLILMLFPFFAFAQLLPGGERERYEDSRDNRGGAGSLYSVYELKYLNLSDNTSVEFATKQGFRFQSFIFGINANFRVSKTVEDPKYIDIKTTRAYFNFNHAGAFADYIVNLSNKTKLTFGTLANFGYSSYELANTLVPSQIIGTYYFIVEPNMNLSYKVYENYAINLGLSYRNTLALSSTRYPSDYYNGYGISLGVKIIK